MSNNNQQRNNQREQQQREQQQQAQASEGQKLEEGQTGEGAGEAKSGAISLNIPAKEAAEGQTAVAESQVDGASGEQKAPVADGEVKAEVTTSEAVLIQTPNPIELSVKDPVLAPEEKIASPVVEDSQAKAPPVVASLKVKATNDRTPPSGVVKRQGATAREMSPPPAQEAQEPASTQFASLVAREKKEGTAYAIDLIAFLERYVVDMAPRKVTTIQTVLRYQEGLLSHITRVIEQAPAAQFKRLWRILIAFTGEYKKGAFGPAYYARGAKDWKGDSKQFDILTSAINLLEASAADIKTVGQVADVSLLANKGFSEEGRGRLLNFYANL